MTSEEESDRDAGVDGNIFDGIEEAGGTSTTARQEPGGALASAISETNLQELLAEFLDSLGTAIYTAALIEEIDQLEEPALEATSILEDVDDEEFVVTDEQKQAVRSLALFFAFSGQVIESLLRELTYNEIIDSSAQTEEVKKTVDNYSTNHCLELLFGGEKIDGDTKSRITQAKKTRNNFLHGLDAWFTPGTGHRHRAQVKRTKRAVRDLLELVLEDEPLEVDDFISD